MAQVCTICGKRKATGNSVSFSQRKNKRSWSPNIVKARINIGGKIKRANVCAKCLKGLNKK